MIEQSTGHVQARSKYGVLNILRPMSALMSVMLKEFDWLWEG